jgi:Ala-tRNA(Pro) deacylase
VTGELGEGPEPNLDANIDANIDAYERLVAQLDAARARYRLIDHAPEGRTDLVSALRGNELGAAAKCMVVMVKVSKKQALYVLAVVPGDTRVDFSSLKAHLGGSYASMADGEKAEQLAGSVAGTILPFSYDARLELVVDPGLLSVPEIYFNAGRLDRSVALSTEDYLRLASPRVLAIATPPVTGGPVSYWRPSAT